MTKTSAAPQPPSPVKMKKSTENTVSPTSMTNLQLLSKMVTFTNSVGGIDKVFRTVIYTLKVASIILQRHEKAPSKDVNPETLPPALSTRLTRLTGPLSETRVVLRLLGLLSTFEWLFSPYTEPNMYRHILDVISRASMLVYYPAEHVYWLACYKVILLTDEIRDRWSRWSCQAWAVYILADALLQADTYFQAYENKEDLEKRKKTMRAAGWRLLVHAADFPLAVHWSLVSSPITPLQVGLCGSVSSLVGIWLRWTAS